MSRDEQRAAAWSRYWQAGAAHSCPGTLDDRLTGAFGDFWRQAASPLEAQARVLEIGAGNGAVTRLLVEQTGAGPAVQAAEFDLVDLADIRPVWLAAPDSARIRCHSRTALEQLPFEPGRFSLVVGQYAFEYADRPPALAQITRCSRPGASLVLVLHHRSSRVVQTAGVEREQLQWLLGDAGPVQATEAVLPYLAQAGQPGGPERLRGDPAAEAARTRLNQHMDELARRAQASAVPDNLIETGGALQQIAQAVLQAADAAAARARLQQLRQSLEDGLLRLEELIARSLPDEDLAALGEDLKRAGYARVETGTLSERGQLMGWTVVARNLQK